MEDFNKRPEVPGSLSHYSAFGSQPMAPIHSAQRRGQALMGCLLSLMPKPWPPLVKR